MEKLTYSIAEAAKVLGISETTMRNLSRTQGFPCVVVGTRRLISIKGLERWVEEQAGKGGIS